MPPTWSRVPSRGRSGPVSRDSARDVRATQKVPTRVIGRVPLSFGVPCQSRPGFLFRNYRVGQEMSDEV